MSLPIEYSIGDEVFELRPEPNDEGIHWVVTAIDEQHSYTTWRSPYPSRHKHYRRPKASKFTHDAVRLWRRKGIVQQTDEK